MVGKNSKVTKKGPANVNNTKGPPKVKNNKTKVTKKSQLETLKKNRKQESNRKNNIGFGKFRRKFREDSFRKIVDRFDSLDESRRFSNAIKGGSRGDKSQC